MSRRSGGGDSYRPPKSLSSKHQLFCYHLEMYLRFSILECNMYRAVSAMLSALSYAKANPKIWTELLKCPKVKFKDAGKKEAEDRDITWLTERIHESFKSIATTRKELMQRKVHIPADILMDEDLQARFFCQSALAICMDWVEKHGSFKVFYELIGAGGYAYGLTLKERHFAREVGGWEEEDEDPFADSP